MKIAFLVVVITSFSIAANADIMEDFDSLGGNKILLDRAQALNPDKKIEIVQNRMFERNWRHEFTPEVAMVLGGDPYVDTNTFSVGYVFHINPQWALGAKYIYFANTLTNEGQFLVDEANRQGEQGKKNPLIPDIDWPEQSYLATLSYSPIYGKFNFMDKAVVHFDAYLLGGYGQMESRNGSSEAYTAGVGVGLWFSQHLTSRFELSVLGYEAKTLNDPQNTNLTTASFSLGYML